MYVCGGCGASSDQDGFCSADGERLAAAQDALLGTEVGRYRIARLLGVGGMGQVYLGVQPMIGSRVAIKVLSNECTRIPELLERFFAEARAVNMIKHESIVSVIDMAQLRDGRPYIVMEFVAGHTLGVLVRGGTAPIGGVVQVTTEMLSALGAAHALGIVHRDLKPDNVLITAEGHAKVLDFGIAKLAPGLSNVLSPRTATGALLGTPAYMAPEQISGAGNVDARTDLYAVGVVLFEAVTGQAPFHGATLYDLMQAHLEQAPPSPRGLRPDLPLSLERVILTALEKDPARRFQSAAAMAQALRDAARDLPPDQWRVLSPGGMISGRSSLEHLRHLTALDSAHAPTVRASMVGAPPTERDRPRRLGPAIAIAALAAVSVGIVLIVVRQGGEPPRAAEPAEIAAKPPPPPAPIATSRELPPAPPPAAPPLVLAPPPSAPRANTAPPPPPKATPAAPVPASPVPTIVGGGSAADHGAHIGPVGGGTTPVPGGQPRTLSRRADYNAKAFEPVAYLAKARQLARTLVPDAELSSFEFDPVLASGHVDLTMEGRDRDYEFRSPARSVLSKGHPRNLPLDRPCRIRVSLTATEITATVLDDDECDDKLPRPPRCTFVQVRTRARSLGVADELVARVGWMSDGTWFFDTELQGKGGGQTSVEDDCR